MPIFHSFALVWFSFGAKSLPLPYKWTFLFPKVSWRKCTFPLTEPKDSWWLDRHIHFLVTVVVCHYLLLIRCFFFHFPGLKVLVVRKNVDGMENDSEGQWEDPFSSLRATWAHSIDFDLLNFKYIYYLRSSDTRITLNPLSKESDAPCYPRMPVVNHGYFLCWLVQSLTAVVQQIQSWVNKQHV